MANYREPPVLDVSGLPEFAFGRRNVTWLANVLYMTIEGTMFALMIATYFYLRTRSSDWPPELYPPELRWGIINAIVLLLSIAPARWVQTRAPRADRSALRLGLLVLILLQVVAMALRFFEFRTLNCRWTDNAYASTVWVLLGLHTGHLITEWCETLAITGVSFTDKMEGARLADAAINSDYWYFVVASAMIVDLVIYGASRWL